LKNSFIVWSSAKRKNGESRAKKSGIVLRIHTSKWVDLIKSLSFFDNEKSIA
jgi:hypothetical protein